MTVQELIDKLSSFPKDLPVLVLDGETGWYSSLTVRNYLVVEDFDDEDWEKGTIAFDCNLKEENVPTGSHFIGFNWP